jgi:hypothetical protein
VSKTIAQRGPLQRGWITNAIELTTSFSGSAETHRIWRQLLRGSRGLILWDDKNEIVDTEGRIGKRGEELAPVLRELHDGLGALFINSQRQFDPVAILYSPASMRVQWLLDRRASREDWPRRNASSEYGDDAIRISTARFAGTLEHLGIQYRFISPNQISEGELQTRGYRVLILPHTVALSPSEESQIRAFLTNGGLVIADGEPGIFDEHGRKLERARLSDLTHGGSGDMPSRTGTAITSITAPDPQHLNEATSLRDLIESVGVRPRFSLTHEDGSLVDDITGFIFENGSTVILALQRDSRLPSGMFGFADLGQTRAEKIVLKLPFRANIYDLRGHRWLPEADSVELSVEYSGPKIIALSPTKTDIYDIGSAEAATGRERYPRISPE